MEIFKELTGRDWYDNDGISRDEEHKITEFDYENYLDPQTLKGVDTESKEFKHLIKALNIFTNTKYEQLVESKEHFRDLMDLFRNLDEKEAKALIHKVRNSGRTEASPLGGVYLTN